MSNQSPVHAGYNAFLDDGVLVQLTQAMPDSVVNTFSSHGRWVASSEALDLARLANENPPRLRTHDAKGNRLDIVEYHPAYHALMRRGISIGLTASIWNNSEAEKGMRNEARAVRFMLTSQLEAGHTCPLTLTSASVAALMTEPEVLKDWLPRLLTREYDSTQKSPGAKKGLTIGMGMTERQGGSDVRMNTTQAEQSDDGLWRIDGEKWFVSAPMCDAFLVLAQSHRGLSCFLVPRLLPDGSNNGLHLQRLKDKVGNRSNASAEIRFANSVGILIGGEDKGVRTITEMMTLTRLDCALGSAGQMRVALSEAVHHCRHRVVYGRKLIEQPLMTRVLADLALEVAAAQTLGLRLARSFDQARVEFVEAGYARLMTPVVKYWVCKTAPAVIAEAMECMGGNGYVEENILARLYRDAPLNGMWEGSGNVLCLDVMQALEKGSKVVPAIFESLARDLGDNTNQTMDVLRIAGDMAIQDEGSARIFTEQLALTAAAAEMRRALPAEIADAFVESRLGRPWRNTYGMMDSRYDARAIIDYMCPQA